MMKGDNLLQRWDQAKKTCSKIIQISKKVNIYQIVVQQKQSNRQFIAVYDVIYHLCATRETEQSRCLMVYKDYKEILKTALISMIQDTPSQQQIYRLLLLRKIWDAYSDILKRLMHMFAYLDKPYNIKEGRIENLYKTGINIVASTLFDEKSLTDYSNIYFQQINRIRKTGELMNDQILKDMVDILYVIHLKTTKNFAKKCRTIYTNFRDQYLKKSKQFYSEKYRQFKQLNPIQYYQQVNKILIFEMKIASNCYVIGGSTLIHGEFAKIFLQKYKQTLLKSHYGLKSIIHNRDTNIFKLINSLYIQLSGSIDDLRDSFQQFIYDEIKSYIEQLKLQFLIKKTINNCCSFIQRLINKNNQYLTMINEIFGNQNEFIHNYKNALDRVLTNYDLPIPIEEILSIYTDMIFKNTGLNEIILQKNVSNIINLFKSVQNKDLFIMRYHLRLAKRISLISTQALSNHEILIQGLKFNCGIKDTQSLSTLIYQFHLSLDEEKLIKQRFLCEKSSVDLNVKVFSEGAWPIKQIVELSLEYFPKQLNNTFQCFLNFKKKITQNKNYRISMLESRIRWTYYTNQSYQNTLQQFFIDTNGLQGAILYYLYRKYQVKTSLEVLEQYFQTVNKKTFRQNLRKMTESKQNIIVRNEDAGLIFYSFNFKMKSNKRLVTYQMNKGIQQNSLFQQKQLNKDRELILQANIAKLMKSKKNISFETLFSEIGKMIKAFNPQKKDIKLAIDRLVSKDILMRDEKQKSHILYKG